MRFALAVLVGLLGWVVSPSAQAQIQNFTLVNQTGYQINELYIGPTTSTRWGNDVLGDDVLPSGRQVPINFRPGNSECLWDIKIVYADRDESQVRGVDLCRISTITLTWSGGRTVFRAN